MEGLSEELKTGFYEFSDTHDYLSKNIEVQGKTIEEWTEYFKVTIPKQTDIVQLKYLISDVAELISECMNIYSSMEFSVTHIKNSEELAVNKRKTELLEGKEVRTAVKAESMARSENATIILSRKSGEMIVEFFNKQLKKLQSLANKLETIASLTMSERKNEPRKIV